MMITGKPVEKQGHKAKGLRSEDYDSRLPHLYVYGWNISVNMIMSNRLCLA